MGQPPGLLVVCSQTPAEMLLGSSQRVPTKRPCVSDCSFTGYIWIPRNPSVVLSFHRGTRFSERTAKETKKQISFQPLPLPPPGAFLGNEGLVLSALTFHAPPGLVTPKRLSSGSRVQGLPFTSSPATGTLCPAWESLSQQETLPSFLSGFLPDLLSLSK